MIWNIRFFSHTRDIAEDRLHLANKLHEDRYQKVDFDAPKKEREAKRRQALEEKQRQAEEHEKAKADEALLFRNWSATYMEKYAPKKSAVRDEFSLRNLNRHLGDMPIGKIIRLVLQEYKKSRIAEPIVRNGHAVKGTRTSAACVNREFSFLQKILDAAVDGELIDNAPSFRKIRTKERPRKRKLTHEEYVRLRDGAVPWLRDMIQANYYMGFSLSDALGLTWGQVDFKEGLIEIQRRKTDQQQLCFLIEPLRAILRRVQFHQSILSARNHVFVNDRKEPVTKDQFQHAFRQALKRTNLEDFRWHDFRRMAATKLAAANVPYESRLKALAMPPAIFTQGIMLR